MVRWRRRQPERCAFHRGARQLLASHVQRHQGRRERLGTDEGGGDVDVLPIDDASAQLGEVVDLNDEVAVEVIEAPALRSLLADQVSAWPRCPLLTMEVS